MGWRATKEEHASKKSPEPPFFSLESLNLFGRFSTGAQALFFSFLFLPPWAGKRKTETKEKSSAGKKLRLQSSKTYDWRRGRAHVFEFEIAPDHAVSVGLRLVPFFLWFLSFQVPWWPISWLVTNKDKIHAMIRWHSIRNYFEGRAWHPKEKLRAWALLQKGGLSIPGLYIGSEVHLGSWPQTEPDTRPWGPVDRSSYLNHVESVVCNDQTDPSI